MNFFDDEWEVVAGPDQAAADEWEPVAAPAPVDQAAADEWEPVAFDDAQGPPPERMQGEEDRMIPREGPRGEPNREAERMPEVVRDSFRMRPDAYDAGGRMGDVPAEADASLMGPPPVTGMSRNVVAGVSLPAGADGTPGSDGTDGTPGVEQRASNWELAGQPALRGPYTERDRVLHSQGEKSLEVRAREFAASDSLMAQVLSKPAWGIFGKTPVGKAAGLVANFAHLNLFPERYSSRITGERIAPTPVEIMTAADQQGLLRSGNVVVDSLAQDLPGFVLGGDAAIASIPWAGFPLLNLTHQVLDNTLAAQEGRPVQFDPVSIGESAAIGWAYQSLPMPKVLQQQDQGVLLKRLGKIGGAAGVRALEIHGIKSGVAAAQGKELPTGDDLAQTLAFMLALQAPQIAFNVQAGWITSGLKKTGIPEGKSSQIANAYVNGTLPKRDLAKAKVMVPHLEKVGLERDLALRILDQTLAAGGKPSGRLNTMWAAVEDELARVAEQGGFDQATAQAAAARAVNLYRNQIGKLPEFTKNLGRADVRAEFVRRAEVLRGGAADQGAGAPGAPPAGADGQAEPWMQMLDGTVLRQVFSDDSPLALLGRHVSRPGRPKGGAPRGAGAPTVPQTFESNEPGRQGAREYLLGVLRGYGLDQAAAGRIVARSEPVPGWRPEDLANLPGADLDEMLRQAVDAPAREGPRAEPNLGRADASPLGDAPALEGPRAEPNLGRADASPLPDAPALEGPRAEPNLGRADASPLGEPEQTGVVAPRADRTPDEQAAADDVEARLVDVPVRQVADGAIAVRPDLMQFRTIEDPKTGVTAKDKIESQKWDDLKGGVLLLWEPAEPVQFDMAPGERYIVANGHHRLEFGRRMNRPGYNVQILREADGVSALEARIIAAEVNIADGKGDIYDQVKFLRNTAEAFGKDEALARAKSIGINGRKAATIAFDAAPRADQENQSDLIDALINEAITPEQAEAIAQAAPGDARWQAVGIKRAGRLTGPELRATLAALQQLDRDKRIVTVDKAQDGDLFGSVNDAAWEESEKMGAAALEIQKELRNELSVLKAGKALSAKRKKETAERWGISVDKPEGLTEAARKIAGELERWDVWAQHSDLVEQVKARMAPQDALPADGGAVPAGAGAPDAPAVAPGGAPGVTPEKAAEWQSFLDDAMGELDELTGLGGGGGGVVKEAPANYGMAAAAAGRNSLGKRARALLQAVDAGRIDRQEAESRFRMAVLAHREDELAAAQAELFETPFNLVGDDARAKMRQIEEARKRREELYAPPDETQAQGVLFERSALEAFAREQGVNDEQEVFKLSAEVQQLDLPGLNTPYESGAGAGNAGDLPGPGAGAAGPGAGAPPAQTGEERLRLVREALGQSFDNYDPKLLQQALVAGGGRVSALIDGLVNRNIPSFNIVGQRITTPQDFAKLALGCRSRLFEVFKLAVRDSSTGRVVYSNVISVGIRNATLIDAQSIIQSIYLAQQVSGLPMENLDIISSHNHPGGDPTPSPEDIRVVSQIEKACENVGLKHADHIITNGKQYYSSAEKGISQLGDNVLLPEDVLAPEDATKITHEGHLATLAAALRQGAPNAGFAVYLTQRYNIREIRQLNMEAPRPALMQEIGMDAARIHAEAVLMVLPGDDRDLVEVVGKALKLQEVTLLDVASPDMPSWRSGGVQWVREDAPEYGQLTPEQAKLVDVAARAVAAAAGKQGVPATAEFARQLLARYGNKFVGLEQQIAAAAQEIADDELRLWQGMRKGELAPEGERDQKRAVAPQGPHGQAAARTDIRIAGQQSLPTPADIVPAGKYEVDEDQRLGINLALARFEAGGRGFLLADGTGMGKTREMLVVAKEYMERIGGKVLIVVPNVQIFQGSYQNDAEALGMDLDSIDVGTYLSLTPARGMGAKIKQGLTRESKGVNVDMDPDQRYSLVICDEAHNLKNLHSQQTQSVGQLLRKADHTMFATATPMDRPTGAAYFLGEIAGVDRRRMARMLGFDLVQAKRGNGEVYESAVLLKDFSWDDVKRNLVNLREAAIRQGAIVRREYPYQGTFEQMDMALDAEDRAVYASIEDYFDAVIAAMKPGRGRSNMKGQKTHAMSAWLEAKKVPVVFERVQRDIAEGRQVVVCFENVNDSNRLRRPEGDSNFKLYQAELWDAILGKTPEIKGPALLMCDMLEQAGIPYCRVFGGGALSAEVDKFQAGQAKAMVMTARSGGAGINADDVVGNAPRSLYLVVVNFAGDIYQQTLGRINRRNTVKPESQQVIEVFLPGAFSDERRRAINKKKQEILQRIQDGADVDLAGFDPTADAARADAGDDEVEVAGSIGGGLFGDNDLSPADLAGEGDPAADMGAQWPGGPLGETNAKRSSPLPMDDPEYSLLPIELPELVQLSRALLDGQYPRVLRSMGDKLGTFTHTVGPVDPAWGRIDLLARIFRLITPEEEQRMREAAKAWAAKFSEPGDNVPAVEQTVFEQMYDDAFRAAKQRNPRLASKVLAHEIGHVIDWLPDHLVRGRGNILGHIASFVDYEKKQLAALPAAQDDLLTPEDRAAIRKEARKEAKGNREAEKLAYRDLVKREMQRRGIITRDEILEELVPVVAWWRGSGDTMEPYFSKPEEMYAEAISVLLNNPAALRARAPKFWQLWQNWLLNKPELSRRYEALQDAINSGQIYKDRVELLYREMGESDDAAARLSSALDKRTGREVADQAVYSIDRRFGPIQKRLGTIKDTTVRRQALGALSDNLYKGAVAELILSRVAQEVAPLVEDGGLMWKHFGEYLFHQRIYLGDRSNLGNPWGFSPKASAERLAEMRRTYGARFDSLQEAGLWLREIFEYEVLRPAREMNVFGDDLQQFLEDNVLYATFAVTRGDQSDLNTLQTALNNRFGGSATGSGIFKQFGTLKPVKNPATATVQKMLALTSFIHREHAKAAAVQALLNTEYADEWRPADMRRVGKHREIVQVETPRIGTLTYMHAGKLHGYYGPRALVDGFKSGDALEISGVAHLFSAANSKLKGIYTAVNPGFWPVAAVRNVRGFNRRMPGTVSEVRNWIPFSGGVFGKYARRAFVAAESSMSSNPNAIARDALRRGMVISRAAGYWGQEQDDEMSRMLQMRGLPAMREEALSTFHAVSNWSQNSWAVKGQVVERMAKIAGMMYLDEKYPNMPEAWKRMNVRMYAGSPDYLERGALNWMMDSIQLFYNPVKEGWRAEKRFLLGSGEEPGRPGEWAWNTVRWTVIPTVWKILLASGALAQIARYTGNNRAADGLEQVSDMLQDGPTETERLAYHIIPLGYADEAERKVLYLRWPLEEQERSLSAVVGALTQAALTRDVDNIMPILTGFMGRELPGVNPLVSISVAVGMYVMGGNPYDHYAQRGVLTDTEQAARAERPAPGRRAMGRHVWNQTLGGLVGRIPPPDRPSQFPTTRIERFLRAPGVQPTLGRWLRVSNAGFRERQERALQDTDTKQALIQMDIDTAVMEQQKTGSLPPAIMTKIMQGAALQHEFGDKLLPSPELELQRYYYTRYQNVQAGVMRSQAPIDARMMMGQGTRARRAALVEQMMDK